MINLLFFCISFADTVVLFSFAGSAAQTRRIIFNTKIKWARYVSSYIPVSPGLLLFLVQREHNGFVSVSLEDLCVYRNRKFLQ